MDREPLDKWYFNYVWKGVLCKRLHEWKKKLYNLLCLLVAKWQYFMNAEKYLKNSSGNIG